MKCNSIEPLLSAFAADELSIIKRWVIRFHVKRCKSCCEELSLYQKTRAQVRRVLQNKAQELPQEAIWPQIEARVEIIRKSHQKRERKTVHKIWKKAIPALAGVIVLLLSLWIHHAKQAPDQEILKPVLPLVEDFYKPGVTMMTFETDDPKISIVWFFKDEDSNQKNTNGGA